MLPAIPVTAPYGASRARARRGRVLIALFDRDVGGMARDQIEHVAGGFQTESSGRLYAESYVAGLDEDLAARIRHAFIDTRG